MKREKKMKMKVRRKRFKERQKRRDRESNLDGAASENLAKPKETLK